MAASVRNSLLSLVGNSPKDVTEKYRQILNQIIALKDEDKSDGFKLFIDAGLMEMAFCT